MNERQLAIYDQLQNRILALSRKLPPCEARGVLTGTLKHAEELACSNKLTEALDYLRKGLEDSSHMIEEHKRQQEAERAAWLASHTKIRESVKPAPKKRPAVLIPASAFMLSPVTGDEGRAYAAARKREKPIVREGPPKKQKQR